MYIQKRYNIKQKREKTTHLSNMHWYPPLNISTSRAATILLYLSFHCNSYSTNVIHTL